MAGTISFSFDDARSDHYVIAREILEPLDIPASFNIPTACVEGKIEVGFNGHIGRKELDYFVDSELFEVASHGDYHKNTPEDIEAGIIKLRDWYPGKLDKLGFVSPQSILDVHDVKRLEPVFQKHGIAYLRTGRAIGRRNIPLRFVSKLSKITKSPGMFVWLYKPSLNRVRSDFFLRGISVLKQNTVEQVLALVDACAEEGAWYIIEMHSVERPENTREYSEEFCWDRTLFEELCSELVDRRSAGHIEIKTVLDAHSS